jgi:hypothetical protein
MFRMDCYSLLWKVLCEPALHFEAKPAPPGRLRAPPAGARPPQTPEFVVRAAIICGVLAPLLTFLPCFPAKAVRCAVGPQIIATMSRRPRLSGCVRSNVAVTRPAPGAGRKCVAPLLSLRSSWGGFALGDPMNAASLDRSSPLSWRGAWKEERKVSLYMGLLRRPWCKAALARRIPS